MTWSYSGDPSSSLKDQVRFLIGDTQAASPYLTDEEISFLLSEYDDNPNRAAIDAVTGIIAGLSGSSSESVGNVSLSNTDALKGFTALLAILQRKFASTASVRAFAGGISRLDKLRNRQNSDRVVNSFSRNDPAPYDTSPHNPGRPSCGPNPKSLGDWEYGP